MPSPSRNDTAVMALFPISLVLFKAPALRPHALYFFIQRIYLFVVPFGPGFLVLISLP